MTPGALSQAERTRAAVAHGGSARLLWFLGVSVVVHGLLAVVLSRESVPRSVPAPRPSTSDRAVVWFESPVLTPSKPEAPVAAAPGLVRAPAVVALPVPRSQAPKRAPVDAPAAPRAAPQEALPPLEEKPPLAELPPSPALTEEGGAAVAQDAASPAVAGAAVAETKGMGTASPEGVAPAPGVTGASSSGSTGSSGATELMAYARRLSQVVGRQRRYPASATRLGMEGTASIRVSVNRDGTLAGAPRLVRSSGHEVLDAEALRMIEAAAPFAPLPESDSRPSAEFIIPVDFSLRPPG